MQLRVFLVAAMQISDLLRSDFHIDPATVMEIIRETSDAMTKLVLCVSESQENCQNALPPVTAKNPEPEREKSEAVAPARILENRRRHINRRLNEAIAEHFTKKYF